MASATVTSRLPCVQAQQALTCRKAARNAPSSRGASFRAHALLPFTELADVAPQVAATGNEVAKQANDVLPGSVSAPAWVIPVALIVVTVGSILSGYLLKPGADAAEKVFERDAKRLGNQAKNRVKKR